MHFVMMLNVSGKVCSWLAWLGNPAKPGLNKASEADIGQFNREYNVVFLLAMVPPGLSQLTGRLAAWVTSSKQQKAYFNNKRTI